MRKQPYVPIIRKGWEHVEGRKYKLNIRGLFAVAYDFNKPRARLDTPFSELKISAPTIDQVFQRSEEYAVLMLQDMKAPELVEELQKKLGTHDDKVGEDFAP